MPRTITVALKRTVDSSYPILVGVRLTDCPRRIRKAHAASQYFIITDSNVDKLYGKTFLRRLKSLGCKAHTISVPPGERSKSRSMKSRIEDRLLELCADRDALIIALGGGMIGDLAGFVAATLHRGIRCVQIPTTLLAQVDSSIGGKVAVDHPYGKNLIGAFSQPEAVYIDPSTLLTLPAADFTSGLAEVVKYGAILDREFFNFLEQRAYAICNRHLPTMTGIITRCCKLKMGVVQKDEREASFRRVLNFGHTIGHAAEIFSHYRISHGNAVAIGMCAEAKIAVAMGLLPARDLQRLIDLLSIFSLPTRIPDGIAEGKIVQLTRHDKKSRQGSVRYTLMERIGRARIGVPLSQIQALSLMRR